MRIVALGFWSGTMDTIEYITTGQRLKLAAQDIVIVDGQGDRLAWRGEGTRRRLAHVLPTPAQKEELRRFLEQGGTILTFPADPFDRLTFPLYPEEVPAHWQQERYPCVISGGLAEIEVLAFDWLPSQTWAALKEAYETFSREKASASLYWEESNQLQRMVASTTQAILIRVGRGNILVCRGPEHIRPFLSMHEVAPSFAAAPVPTSSVPAPALYAA